MSRYLLRLDDASDYSDRERWQRMENLLDRYGIRPIVGIIPDNQDPEMVESYPRDEAFWQTVARWQQKGWTLALHGCTHEYITKDGGLNPVNHRSEFAGVPLEEQCAKIRRGVAAKQYKTAPIRIGNNVWIGANCVILRGTVIGDNSVVGAGTVLKGIYPPDSLIVQKRETQVLQKPL